MAREWPTGRVSIQLVPCSAIRPRRENEERKAALSAQKRRSQNSSVARPRPAATPFTAAMIGLPTDGK